MPQVAPTSPQGVFGPVWGQLDHHKDNIALLILSMGGPELTVQGGGGQKRLRYIFWPYLLNGSSDQHEI